MCVDNTQHVRNTIEKGEISFPFSIYTWVERVRPMSMLIKLPNENISVGKQIWKVGASAYAPAVGRTVAKKVASQFESWAVNSDLEGKVLYLHSFSEGKRFDGSENVQKLQLYIVIKRVIKLPTCYLSILTNLFPKQILLNSEFKF